jgi:hypothetical protein
MFCLLPTLLLGLASISPVAGLQSTFYFHDNSELTFSYPPFQIQGYQVSGIQASPSSTSAHVFETANPTASIGNGVALSMSSTISLSGQLTVYGAFVAWVSNPFPTNVTLDGDVVMHVWMSSGDVLLPWQGTRFIMGLADYWPAGSTQFQLLDDYFSNMTIGSNGLSSSPNEYTISALRINQHEFHTGSMLLFFAGAGSNKQGYSFTVYFDSPTWQSRADIPADSTLTMPEFPNFIPLTLAALLLPIILVRRKP